MPEPEVRRRSASPADLAARRQGYTPTRTRTTGEATAVPAYPRSSLRHRPIGTMYVIPLSDGSAMQVTERELEDLPANYQNAARRITPPQGVAPRASKRAQPQTPVHEEETEDNLPPAHTGATERLPRQRSRRFPRFHWLFWGGLAMLLMLAGWIALNGVSTWWTNQINQWTYGYPRTYQVDANVGHGTTANPDSHFLAENLHNHLLVIEFPGDDLTHARIYIGPILIGDGQDLTPVTLSFEDVNNDGKPDLVLHVGDSKFIFLNTATGFKVAPNQ